MDSDSVIDPSLRGYQGASVGLSTSDAYHTLLPLMQAAHMRGESPQSKAQKKKKAGERRGRPKKTEHPAIQSLSPGIAADPSINQDLLSGSPEALVQHVKPGKKRRRKQVEDGDAPEQDGALDLDHEAEQVMNKRPRIDGHVASPGLPAEPEGLTEKDRELRDTGPLTKAEWHMAECALAEFRNEHNIEQHKVNDYVQSTNRAQSTLIKELWTRLYESLPHRQHTAVMRACRRRFNNYEARGKWTSEEDDALRQSYESHPGKWVKIGSILARMPEDCRDRWRNYLSCGQQRRMDDWTEREELDLSEAVNECSEAAKQEAKEKAKKEGHAFREQDWESYVNFNIVSEKMGFTRSRLQCYTHWRIMQNRAANVSSGQRGGPRRSNGMSNRQNRALVRYRKMTPADKYQILCQVAATNPTEFDEIPWKQITRDDTAKRWSTREKKEAFAKMVEDYAIDQPDVTSTLSKLKRYFEEIHADQLELVEPPVEAQPSIPIPEETEKPADEPLDGKSKTKKGPRGPYMTKKRRALLDEEQQREREAFSAVHQDDSVPDDNTGSQSKSAKQRKEPDEGARVAALSLGALQLRPALARHIYAAAALEMAERGQREQHGEANGSDEEHGLQSATERQVDEVGTEELQPKQAKKGRGRKRRKEDVPQ